MKIFNLFLILIMLSSCEVYRLDVSSRELLFEDSLKTLQNFNIDDQVFYNDNDVWFSKEMLSMSDSGLVIRCIKDTSYHEDWRLKKVSNWTSGMINTRGKIEFSNGLWIIEAKLNSGWPAIWLLKNDYIPEGFSKAKIIPEIDIVETIHNKFRHTVHWGYSDDAYRLYETGKNIGLYDDMLHAFAVDCLPDGYDFYIDGIRTASFRSNDPQFVSNEKNYLIINNAATSEDSEETIMIIKSIKIYK
jgi:beta-glucanase (GH16 family)